MRRVLIVEDELNIRLVLRLALQRQFDVREAGDGRDALAVIRTWRPDLAVVDIDMPHLDGIALCQTLKADPRTRDIRVVFLTGMAQLADRRQAEEAGADAYLTKPFSPARLATALHRLLEAEPSSPPAGSARGLKEEARASE